MNGNKLDTLLNQYKKVLDTERELVGDIDEKLVELQSKRTRLAAPFEKKLGQLLESIEIEMKYVEKSYACEDVGLVVKFRASYTKGYWDDAALCTLEVDKPAIWKAIEQCRKLTEVKASVKVERTG